MGSERKYLTESQVAEMLGVPPRTLQTWRLQRRVLPFVKLGSSVRYCLADVQKHLEKNAVAVAN